MHPHPRKHSISHTEAWLLSRSIFSHTYLVFVLRCVQALVCVCVQGWRVFLLFGTEALSSQVDPLVHKIVATAI